VAALRLTGVGGGSDGQPGHPQLCIAPLYITKSSFRLAPRLYVGRVGGQAVTDQPLRVEKRPEVIGRLLPEIIAIANLEREALGFLAEGAYRDAVARRHVYLMVQDGASGLVVAGFILFGGVYPNARVQQIGVRPDFRRAKVGSRLVASLVSELEKQSYLTLTAKIASNLSNALGFYRKNGFEQVATRRGGSARNREILVHVRHLDTPNLFSVHSPADTLNISIRNKIDAPLYAFDLNVLFDLVRVRERHQFAAELFGAALDHRVRLVVSGEFVEELRRTSANANRDPILQMALRLPQLPKVSALILDKLADEIHEIVFIGTQNKGAGSAQARSDCRHLAHASISRAAAFITSDNAILESQEKLLKKFGIDVAGIDDLLEILPSDAMPEGAGRTVIGDYEIVPLDLALVEREFEKERVPTSMLDRYRAADGDRVTGRSIYKANELLAFGCLYAPSRQDHYNLLIYVQPAILEPEALADYLISDLVRAASRDAPATLLLDLFPGQVAVRKVARARGFRQLPGAHEMAKVAIGRPLTPSRWRKLTDQLRRRMGVTVSHDEASGVFRFSDQSGVPIETSSAQLEEMLGPTLIAMPGRSGVIVPIARRYADQLLDTAPQQKLGFVKSKRATLLNRRGYVNSPRAAKNMTPGAPIFFYESARSQGRGAIVAVARVVDSVLVQKEMVGENDRNMLVVDELESFSVTEQVLLTIFDSLMPIPTPVPLNILRRLGAVGRSNLISATPVTDENVTKILDIGWADE
jgi:L-amino acid N-acyltransferase YncA